MHRNIQTIHNTHRAYSTNIENQISTGTTNTNTTQNNNQTHNKATQHTQRTHITHTINTNYNTHYPQTIRTQPHVNTPQETQHKPYVHKPHSEYTVKQQILFKTMNVLTQAKTHMHTNDKTLHIHNTTHTIYNVVSHAQSQVHTYKHYIYIHQTYIQLHTTSHIQKTPTDHSQHIDTNAPIPKHIQTIQTIHRTNR